jgi:hypothetical protein
VLHEKKVAVVLSAYKAELTLESTYRSIPTGIVAIVTTRQKLVVSILFIVAAYLAFKNLGSAYLWDDECEVAIFGNNLLNFGELTGWDGRNLFASYNGTTLDANMHSVQPPLMFFVAAASFKLFGVSTWTARLPFASIGVLSLLVFWQIIKTELNEAGAAPAESCIFSRAQLYCFASLCLSTSFLLFIRNSRYYSLAIFFSLATYYFYHRALKNPELRHAIPVSLCATALFYAHFLLAAVFLGALAVQHVIFERPILRQQLLSTWLPAAGVFALLVVPYAIMHRIWDRPDMATEIRFLDAVVTTPWYIRKPLLVMWSERDICLINGLSLSIVVAILVCRFYLDRNDALLKTCMRWCCFTVLQLFLLGLLSPQETAKTSTIEIRYLAAILPFGVATMGMFFAYLQKFSRVLACTLLALVVCTNALAIGRGLYHFRSILPSYPYHFRWTLPAYLKEIHNPYPTGEQAATDYLRAHARQDDQVLVLPSYDNLPVMFYAGDVIKTCCYFDDNSHLWQHGADKLPIHGSRTRDFPDWIVVFGATPQHVLQYCSRPHVAAGGATEQFNYKPAAQLDVYAGNSQRPELDSHHFGPVTDFDRRQSGVVIYSKTTGQSPQ